MTTINTTCRSGDLCGGTELLRSLVPIWAIKEISRLGLSQAQTFAFGLSCGIAGGTLWLSRYGDER